MKKGGRIFLYITWTIYMMSLDRYVKNGHDSFTRKIYYWLKYDFDIKTLSWIIGVILGTIEALLFIVLWMGYKMIKNSAIDSLKKLQ